MTETSTVINVSIAFRNMEATDALKGYATDKLKHCLTKFIHKETEAHVILKVEKTRQIAEVTCHYSGTDFHVKEESADMYASIDLLCNALTEQMRRHKEKVTSHH